jgi:hypothetical protein
MTSVVVAVGGEVVDLGVVGIGFSVAFRVGALSRTAVYNLRPDFPEHRR